MKFVVTTVIIRDGEHLGQHSRWILMSSIHRKHIFHVSIYVYGRSRDNAKSVCSALLILNIIGIAVRQNIWVSLLICSVTRA